MNKMIIFTLSNFMEFFKKIFSNGTAIYFESDYEG